MVRYALSLVLALAVLPARADEVNPLKLAMTGQTAPLTLKLKNLDEHWVSFTVNAMPGYGEGSSANTRSFDTVLGELAYFTQGDTINLPGGAYLVAYQFGDLSVATVDEAAPAFRVPTPEDELRLTLLAVPAMGQLTQLRRFELAGFLAEAKSIWEESKQALPAEAAHGEEGAKEGGEEGASSQERLEQLIKAISAYAENHGALPPLGSVKALQAALRPYLDDDGVYLQPGTLKPYRLNEALSGKKVDDLPVAAETVVLYENRPSPDGARYVAGATGLVWRVPADEWEAVRKASKLP